jgi:gluconokinase
MYVIGIDIGTTNTKAVAFTDRGETISEASSTYPVISELPGRHELDPDRLLEAVLQVLKEVLDELEGVRGVSKGEQLAGIAFSCAMHSLILVDEEGKPMTRAVTWADLRSKPFAEKLKAGEAGRMIYHHTGTPIHPMSPLCKLMWFRSEEPELFRRAARFISIKEYIWWRLFGEYEVDYSLASCTGLFDIRTLGWYGPSLEQAGIGPERLSKPVPCMHTARRRRPDFRDLDELPADLPFIIGSADGCLANLGTHVMKPGETALTIGTSGAVRMMAEGPAPDPKERIFNYVLTEKHYVCGGATNNGGNAVQWFVERCTGQSIAADELEKQVVEAFTVEPGCDGLLFLPFLLGERAPFWNANASAVFFGLRPEQDHRHLLRAVLEGVSYSLYQIGVSLEETVGAIGQIYASGGFIHSPEWLQLIADVFGRRVVVTDGADASATGAAMMGLYALGLVQELDAAAALVRTRETYEPNEKRHRIYKERAGAFCVLYERLQDLMQ